MMSLVAEEKTPMTASFINVAIRKFENSKAVTLIFSIGAYYYVAVSEYLDAFSTSLAIVIKLSIVEAFVDSFFYLHLPPVAYYFNA